MQIDPLELIIAAVIFLFFGAFIIRWVFKIERQLQNQKATVWLLIFLAEKMGVDPAVTKEVKERYSIEK